MTDSSSIEVYQELAFINFKGKSCLRVGQEQYAYHVIFDNYMVQGSAERLLDKNNRKN